ncbi:MAG TPA: antibiotic biosynthesis monooxygenase [Spirillospora sp.]
MLSALLALLAALGASVATGLLIKRAYLDRLLYLIAWSFTQVGVSLALLSMGFGFLAGFNGFLFRVVELGAALFGPLWLALGMVELIARYVQIRFGAWLFTISYTVVATVILLLDPLKGELSKDLPKPGDTYDTLPLLLIDGSHVVAVLALAGCTGFTAWLASRQDQESAELLIPIALVALAGVLVVSGTRGFLPAPLAVIALGAAAGLVWYGAMRTLPVYDDEGYDDYEDDYGDEPASGYDEQGYPPPKPKARPEPEPESVPSPTPSRDARRGELRFPDPAPPEELRFPESPAGSTAVDGVGGAAAALGNAPGGDKTKPSGLAGACGQITVYTLLEGREAAFDRLAADLVKAAIAVEPDTVVFACHEVVGGPTQRIFYQLFRDEAAFAAHRQQPHLKRFLAESRPHVLATNVIELRLGAAKVPLPAPEFPGR